MNISEIAIKRPVFTVMVTVALLVLGFIVLTISSMYSQCTIGNILQTKNPYLGQLNES